MVATKLATRKAGGDQRSKYGTMIGNAKAAEMLNVSEHLVDNAKAVLREDPKAAAKIEARKAPSTGKR